MIRTQLYIPESLHKELTRAAETKGEPMAKLVREFIQEGLAKLKGVDRTGVTALQHLIDMKLTGGPRDLSTNHDHYLYGAPRKDAKKANDLC